MTPAAWLVAQARPTARADFGAPMRLAISP